MALQKTFCRTWENMSGLLRLLVNSGRSTVEGKRKYSVFRVCDADYMSLCTRSPVSQGGGKDRAGESVLPEISNFTA